MADAPKSRCHANCGSGGYMPKGRGRVAGFMGAKGNLYECMRCKKMHVFNDRGEFLGFAS